MRCFDGCGSDGWLPEERFVELHLWLRGKASAHVALCKRGGVWCRRHPKMSGLPIILASTRRGKMLLLLLSPKYAPLGSYQSAHQYTGVKYNGLDTIIHRPIHHLDGCVHVLCTCLSSFFILKSIIIKK